MERLLSRSDNAVAGEWQPHYLALNSTAFCHMFNSHVHYRNALRSIDMIVQTTDPQPAKTFPRDSAIFAKCCSAFPGNVPRWGQYHIWSTNSQTDREDSSSPTQHISMHAYQLSTFLHRQWPILLNTTNSSFVLVTGLDDYNIPWEYFRCIEGRTDRYAKPEWVPQCAGPQSACRLRSLLGHPRLVHWYTQNLDILPHRNKRLVHPGPNDAVGGCQSAIAGSRHDSDFSWERDEALLRKLSPIPIGPRIHTQKARKKKSSNRRDGPCDGAADLDLLQSLQHDAPPLLSRRQRVLAAFDPLRDRRAAALRELRATNVTDVLDTRKNSLNDNRTHGDISDARQEAKAQAAFWRLIQQYAFIATPASHGQDTHRFWEALYLGAIPIVLTGPLDGMYKSFPCVIVQSWTEVGHPGQLQKWLAHINRFKWDQRLLTSTYYAERIKTARPTFPDFYGASSQP
jgi:hypothetical protein